MLVRSYVQLTHEMGGKLNKRVLDEHGLYRAATEDLADDLGWKRREVWNYFVELTFMREYEMRIPRALAEWFALQDLRACIDKRGQEGN